MQGNAKTIFLSQGAQPIERNVRNGAHVLLPNGTK
jgi:hypothetical protein